ncbi:MULTISPECIES: hypothetical protein [unclassified Microcoleus]|uniref:hypothetical protein n=1 Tax=unclassified Microcoleus TaxID=2642155 RepID=UPI002FD1DB9A
MVIQGGFVRQLQLLGMIFLTLIHKKQQRFWMVIQGGFVRQLQLLGMIFLTLIYLKQQQF